VPATSLKPLDRDVIDAGCEVRGDDSGAACASQGKAASTEDGTTNIEDAIIAESRRDGVDEGRIAHIHNRLRFFVLGHTDAIVTEEPARAKKFINEVRFGR